VNSTHQRSENAQAAMREQHMVYQHFKHTETVELASLFKGAIFPIQKPMLLVTPVAVK